MTDPGYDFVPLSPDVRRAERGEARWDRRVPGTLAGYITATLTVEQPLHVGAGSKVVRAPHVVLRGARIRGRPGVPGSSLKGVLRARYEAITRSCTTLWPDTRIVKIRSSTTDIRRARLTPSAKAPIFDDLCKEHSACPACALFGRMSLRSRVTVTDFEGTSDTQFALATLPDRFGPNLHHVGPRRIDPTGKVFEVHGLFGRKFHGGRGPAMETRHHVEVISVGSVLTGQIRVFNASPAELGGLMTALGYDPSSGLTLGGGKAHGFGRVTCRVRCTMVPCGSAALEPERWRQAFVESPDRWAGGESQLIRLHRGH
jgi:hypothetical protein